MSTGAGARSIPNTSACGNSRAISLAHMPVPHPVMVLINAISKATVQIKWGERKIYVPRSNIFFAVSGSGAKTARTVFLAG